MKIAILAWGSLLWDQREIKLRGDWEKTGFKLPLAYSRISEGGNGRITLVLDDVDGIEQPIYYGEMTTTNLNNAINLLKERERTILRNIGYINIAKKSFRSQTLEKDPYLLRIYKWAHENGFDGVIWTDLKTNWHAIRGVSYSLTDAKKYLNYKRNTDIIVYNKSIEYISNAYYIGKICLPLTRAILKIDCK